MRKLLGVAAAAATLLSFTSAEAAQVLIVNADFSQGHSQADGAYTPNHVRATPGWVASGGSGTGHWNPTAADFAEEAAHGPVGWTTGPIALAASSEFIGQVIQNLIIQANTRYTLTLETGRYTSQVTAGAYDFGLIAGWGAPGGFIAARSQGPAGPSGIFTPRALVFETGATGPAIGKSLMVALGSGGAGTAYDNISLDATSLSAAVPEPASWAMMITGFGLAGGLVRRRRTLALAG